MFYSRVMLIMSVIDYPVSLFNVSSNTVWLSIWMDFYYFIIYYLLCAKYLVSVP